MAIGKRPFNLGFFTYLAGPGAPGEVYPNVVNLMLLAEEVGLDKVWVAQHHFGHHGGLPSPFVLFSSIAARTTNLGFGTAIVALPYEHHIRLAEDAAVFETLHPGRLDLGLGTGFGSDAVMETFGIAGKVRRELYDAALPLLQDAFEGKSVNSANDTLFPVAPNVRNCLWESPSRVDGAIAAAQRGNGLLLSRVAIGVKGVPTDVVQRELVDAYVANLPEGTAPRLGLSRTVYPSPNAQDSYNDLATSLQDARTHNPDISQAANAKMTIDEEFEHFSLHWGTPEQVVASLRDEPLLDEITDLIFQVQPGRPDYDTTVQIIRLMAEEVGPALGWQPAQVAAVV